MNDSQKKAKRRAQRQHQKEIRLQKQQALEEAEPEGDIPDVLETGNEPEPTEKDYGPYMATDVTPMMVPLPGPISFDELDEERQAEQEAQAVRETTWDVEQLVRNILIHPEMDTPEKVDALHAVADSFGSRVDETLAAEEKSLEADPEYMELKALIALDDRHMSLPERGEMLLKRVLSTTSRNSLSDGDFALVVNRGGKKVRKYPIHDKAHVRNALARAAQMIARGGQAASDARAAMGKIRAAAKKFGIGSSEKERHVLMVEKDASGAWRWVGTPSNNFQDLDGDIISEAAHIEYVGWFNKNKDIAPVFVSWHTPGTARKAPVDFAMYEKGFLIMSGVLTDEEAVCLLKAQTKYDLGMSHGSLVFERDQKDHRIVNKYRMYEISDLPIKRAANPFTDLGVISKEVGMDKDKVDYLATVLGSKERAEQFLERLDLKQKALEEVGVESKEQKVETPPTPPAKTTPAPEMSAAPEPPKMDETVDAVLKALDVDGLNAVIKQFKDVPAAIDALKAEIQALKTTKEQELVKLIEPPAARKFEWSSRASESEGNVVTEEEKKEKTPGVPAGYWLSEVTGTTPIKES